MVPPAPCHLPERQIGGMPVSVLGLGCSRLGSVLGATRAEGAALLHAALDGGITLFDTADIYGQGDSERLLGQVIGRRDDVLICTKIGKRLPLAKRLAVPLKPLIRGLAGRNATVRQGVGQSRALPLPAIWAPACLARAIDGSLRRTGRERLDILLLHSPPAPVIAAGEALGALDLARRQGKVGMIGVSADDPAAALAALERPEVAVLQLPLNPGDTRFDPVLIRAAGRQVAVIAREVLGGVGAHSGPLPRAMVQDRLRQVAAQDGVTLALVGTTNRAHLRDALDAFGG